MRGKQVEMFGLIKATLGEDGRIEKLEVFYDPETFLRVTQLPK